VQPVVALDRAIAEMSIHSQNARKDIDLLWGRMDEGKRERAALSDEIGDVNEKVAEMKHTAKGATWVLCIVLGLVQTFMAGSIGWVFYHINENSILNRLQQQRIDGLEKIITEGTQS
jgi:hypothetical protein